MFITIITFIVILGLLVFIHELGHFLIAKVSGVKVEEFAFGFPPRIFSWKKKETVYAINLIPLGGYVKLLGEEGETGIDNTKKVDQSSYSAKPVSTRVAIVVAGVIMNFILAVILMTIGFSVGMPPLVSDPAQMTGIKESKVMVVYVQPNSVASRASIVANNIIDGFSSTTDLQKFTRENLGKEVSLTVQNNGQKEDLLVKLSDDKTAPLGVEIVPLTTVKQPVWRAFITSITETGKAIGALFSFLGNVIKSIFTTGHAGAAAEGVVGPVGLFNFTAAAIKIGWIYVLQLLILLSINLGIVNILPFPALDGGKVLFLALEGIFRKKVVKQDVENIIHFVGFALLILLFIAITYRDIRNFF
jgi:regulator of sigma E protease